ncbi:GA module [Gardnerella vaginalis]|uniref:GA module n=1 Tax=Gardnerella vaginalis TaxID=2702 RepID=A0A3E1IR88_GARVA|nr:GA module-containing protein [Gardnerella vaginalis]RFD75198.1 GA module [Gardnerella vaginalis]
MRSYACRCYGARGGVFVSTPAYADGYVDGSGNNIYYGYKTDASYSEARFHIEVDYYDTLDNAKAGKDEGKNPLGKFVRVHYLSNCDQTDGGKADDWRFRPMWWFGVPAGLKEPQDIHFKRTEKLTSEGNKKITPTGSSQQVTTDANGYGVVSNRSYATPKEWNGISNFYLTGDKVLASKGWKQLLGLDDKGSKGYDKVGNTETQWQDYQKETAGLQGIFVDWESAGTRYYDMTYVAEMTQDAWEKRDEHPLRFAAGVYRFAGNWHYAAGQKHNTPKIADHLTLKYPDVTLVKDPSKLSEDEKKAVKKAIEDANKSKDQQKQNLFDKLVAENGVVVNTDGSATITFKDKTTRKIPANILVAKGESDSDKYKPQMPERTPVVKPSQLTKEDKEAVLKAFKKANEKNKDFNDHVKAGDDGIKFSDDGTKLVITYKDDSTLEISASELVYQGATIADWAPYVVPDTIEVDDLKKLSDSDITKIKNAFDTANQGITPYDESKTKNGNNAPVEVNKTTGDVTITWKDGSTTTIDAWQFLKEKKKATPKPPTQEAEKTFIVESSDKPIVVTFDPFKTTSEEITTAGNVNTQLEGLKSTLKKLKGKDSKDNSDVTITGVEYSVDNGVGYITFKAEGYKSSKYPMSAFFKQNPNSKVLPQTGTTTNSQDKKGYKYNLRKFAIKGSTPTPDEKNAAVKQFVGDNYDGNVNDCSNGTYYLNQGLKPKDNTSGLKPSVSARDGLISYIKAEDDSIKFYGTSNNVLDTIKDVYLTNQGGAQSDTTIADLKAQAKALLQQKRGTDKLSNNDLARSGIKDADKLNNDSIEAMNDEKALRDLIRKLTDATKAVYKYNTNPYGVDNPDTIPDEDFQAAVKQFLHANYDDSKASATDKIDNLTFAVPNTATLTGKGWTPKAGTSCLELKSDSTTYGITTVSVNNNDYVSAEFKNGDTVLFTVPANKLYKKKAAPEPAPKPGEKSKLDKMKEKAKEMIERNPNLTPEDKKKFKKQVDDAHDANGVNTALNNANAKAKENKNNISDPSIQQQISNNKQGTTAQQQADDDKKKKEKEEHDKKQKQQLQDDKKKASEQIDKLDNLTSDEKQKLKNQINGNGQPDNPTGVDTPEKVQKILDDAKNLNEARELVKVGELPFLDHGTGKDEDKALNDILGSKSAKDSVLATLEEKIKAGSTATAKEIKTALDAAKRQNEVNEANAKAAGIAKLEAKKAELDAAYNSLTEDQKKSAKEKYDAAITAITNAESAVNKATKPSQIKDALNIDATIKAAKDVINTQVTNAKKKNAKDPSQTQNGQLDEEKEAQKKRIQDSDLPDAEKQKAIKDINDATKLGDPTAIADRALKAKKIEDALKKIDEFKHLNKAQKDAFKAIINGTDAGNHTNDDGTTTDDIDDALANATATDTAMARLEELKKKANEFKDKKDGKYSKLDSTNPAEKKQKDDFDKYLDDATTLTTANKGDAKNADQVNDLYKDLLKAMQAIDKDAKGAGVNTDALVAEIKSDKGLKPDDKADPKTPGDSVYTTASQDKKTAFDTALSEAETALQKANDDNADQAKPGTTPRTPEIEAKAQKAVDDALKKLEEARKALDGVNTKPLEQQIAKDADIKANVRYTNADADKKQAYDDALAAAKKLITDLTTPSAAGASTPQYGNITLDSKENKQKALDEALKALQKAYNELNGVAPAPTPAPTPAAVDKTALAAEIALDSNIGRRMSYIVSPSDKQLAYDRALSKARAVYADPSATQDDVNAALEALRAAARALSGYGSVDNDVNPLPTPSPVPGGAGFGVNDNAPTTVDKGELNIQIDSAEADSQPGNAGAGNNNAGNNNAGNNNAGNANANAANANNNAANGANSAAVNTAVENSPAVKQADAQVAKAQAALDSALAEAKKVAADPNATQAQVDAAAQKLSAARKALAEAKAHAAQVRASVRAQVLKSGVSQLSKTGSNVSVIGLLATVAAAGAAFFVSKRRGVSRHSNN